MCGGQLVIALLLLALTLAACDKSKKGDSSAPGPPTRAGSPSGTGGGGHEPIQAGAVRVQIAALRQAVDLYQLEHSEPPDSLDMVCPGGAPKDPWGTPYQYRVENGTPLIWSAGPDKISGTTDDIRAGQ